MRHMRIIGLLAALLLAACSTPQPFATVTPTDEPFYAWDFTLTALDGETYTLSDLRGQWVIVNFWATWCAPCRDEMPVFQALYETHDTLEILAINQNESAERVTAFRDDLKLTFPLLLDPPSQVLYDYQVLSLPQTIIVDPNGELVWRAFGPLELERFEALLSELQAAYMRS